MQTYLSCCCVLLLRWLKHGCYMSSLLTGNDKSFCFKIWWICTHPFIHPPSQSANKTTVDKLHIEYLWNRQQGGLLNTILNIYYYYYRAFQEKIRNKIYWHVWTNLDEQILPVRFYEFKPQMIQYGSDSLKTVKLVSTWKLQHRLHLQSLIIQHQGVASHWLDFQSNKNKQQNSS